ncbi:MAG: ATP-binding cassette domain-containing protein [Acetobacteraceae bacterium]|nr:ATP-binding cassette domain-containing protein [Acetobacteraceae bacterium]
MLEVDSLVLGCGTGAAFTPAVAGMSFAVGQGETAALLGSSGCGKSTILKAIAGFLRAQPGRLDDLLFRL